MSKKDDIKKLSVNVPQETHDRIEKARKDFQGTGISVSKSTYINLAINNQLKKDKK